MSIKFFALHDLCRDVARHSRCSTAPSAVYHPSGWGGNLREKWEKGTSQQIQRSWVIRHGRIPSLRRQSIFLRASAAGERAELRPVPCSAWPPPSPGRADGVHASPEPTAPSGRRGP